MGFTDKRDNFWVTRMNGIIKVKPIPIIKKFLCLEVKFPQILARLFGDEFEIVLVLISGIHSDKMLYAMVRSKGGDTLC